MPFHVGPPELIIVLIVVLVIFGPGKLPDLGSALGKSIREFRKGTEIPAPVEPAGEAEVASLATPADKAS